MADTKAKSAAKAERKKPVRKAPKQSDYPTRLAWLAAMVEYEEAQAKATTDAKVERLDKRIATREGEIARLTRELHQLRHERNVLTGGEVEVDLPEAEDETTAG